MGNRRFVERGQAVTALQSRNEATSGVALCNPHEFGGHPGIVLGIQIQIGQRVETVGIEPSGDKYELRRKAIEFRQDAGDICLAELT